MNSNLTKENIEKIKKWKEYIDNGHYGNARDIVNTYNLIFKDIKKPQQYTTCGSCLKRCVIQMYNEVKLYEEEKLKALEALDAFMSFNDDEDELDEPTQDEVLIDEPKKKGRPKVKE